ncbi:MAG TPA: EVE domain-containing protein, partial [Candidatus Berkiella sp.]|nr:EVE domain-containing protein [Candidatus Berkiella sp.]
MSANYWLMKSEPDTFSIDDLKKAPKQITAWEGVRNFQARNFLRDQFQVGDLAFFYHSSCKIPAIVGMMEVIRTGLPDLTACDPKSPYYDPQSSMTVPRWYLVEVKLKEKFNTPITLSALKMNPKLSKMRLLQRG